MNTISEQYISSAPNAFTENHGQIENDDVRFYAQGGAVWFTDSGVWFELREYVETRGQGSKFRDQEQQTHTLTHTQTHTLTHTQTHTHPNSHTQTQKYKRIILKQEFIGANQVQPIGRERLSWNSNFFYGNDSEKWCTDVPNYAEIYYENLYSGIDLRYYSNNNGLKYDFIVHPGADFHQIKIKYIGTEEIKVDEFGNMMIKTEIQTIMDSNLFVYQIHNKHTSEVQGKFKICDNLTYGFEITGKYQRDEILIIDPVIELKYSTYIGGGNNEEGIDIAADNAGNAFVTGFASSSNFPITPGVYDTSLNGGYFGDIFVLKLDKNGSAPIYSTFIGGNGNEIGVGIKIDSIGNAYVAGQTDSSNFPFTSGAFDTTFNGSYDAVIFKLNSTGSALLYSTFIGGDQWEVGFDIAIDLTGNAFVTGSTSSSDFPTTKNAYDTSINSTDCFVVKLEQNGTDLIYATVVGGSGIDEGYGIVNDSLGNTMVTGQTRSFDFPTTENAHDRIYTGNGDVFVFKLDRNGNRLIYSTYIGSTGSEIGWAITKDTKDNAYVTGKTGSKNFPTTFKVFDSSYNGNDDVFVFKLNHNGTKLLFSTFIGGTEEEGGNSIALDPLGNVVVAGTTFSFDFPNTTGALDRTMNGTSDHFLFMLNQTGTILEYSSYIGGSGDEHKYFDAYFLRGRATINEKGYVFMTGESNSTDLYTTPGVHDSSYNGNLDTFVLKFFITPIFEIESLNLLQNAEPVTTVYSKLQEYTFRVSVKDTSKPSELQTIQLHLDPMNTDLQVSWNRETGQFNEVSDVNNYIQLASSSKAYKESWDNWIIDFNVTFNWTYPDEELHDAQVFATHLLTTPRWLNRTNIYQVENDLVFNGELVIRGEGDRIIEQDTIVRGGEELDWIGLKPVYEDTKDTYPPADEVDVTIWDELYNSWVSSPVVGQPFDMKISTPEITRTNGFNYTMNLTGIPRECDKTNNTFRIRLDHENVTYLNPKPEPIDWQRTSNVIVGVTILDLGGAEVNGSSIYYGVSDDNGTTWSAWEHFSNVESRKFIKVQNSVKFKDGADNLIKWKAADTVGNGPTESSTNLVLVDTENISFSDHWPTEIDESASEEVAVGISIFDQTSGVDASRISYSYSYDAGKTWYYWKPVKGFKTGHFVNVTINLTFPNGTDNLIKWQAYDIAGNGPTETDEYIIKVNIPKPPIIPEVILLAPKNGSMITSSSTELSWMLNNSYLIGVLYDIYLDTVNPPSTINHSGLRELSIVKDGLVDGETYYWRVIPRLGSEEGICTSGVWSFTVDIPIPRVTLISPENGSTVRSTRPTFIWSVEYNGTETPSFDIYLGLTNSPTNFSRVSTTNFLPYNSLEDGRTYYWKVMPWAGEQKGRESETWSFTVNMYELPKIALNLTLDPSLVKLAPGNQMRVKAIVTNLGEITDYITMNITVPLESGISAIVDKPKTMYIVSQGTGVFNITVISSRVSYKKEIDLLVTATSGKAVEYGYTYDEQETLKVIILDEDARVPEKGSNTTQIWIIIAVLVIIFMALVILLFMYRKKKSKDQTNIDTTPINPQGSLTPEQAQQKETPAKPEDETGSSDQPALVNETLSDSDTLLK